MPLIRRILGIQAVGLAVLVLQSFPLSARGSELAPETSHILKAADYDAFTRVPRRPPRRPPEEGDVTGATFEVTYNGFSQEAQDAFQFAVDIWSDLIESTITIRVNATWTVLGENTLGSAGSEQSWVNVLGAPIEDAAYPDAMADAFGKADLDEAEFDISARFNSDFDWYLGTDANTPAGQYDLVTVVLHELGHGLGFFGDMTWDDGQGDDNCTGVAGEGCWLGVPERYNFFAVNGSSTPLLSFEDNSIELGDELTSGDIFFNGPKTVFVAEELPELYTPNPWDPGSSFSHLDEVVYPTGGPDSLMTPALARAEAIHDPGKIALCMFEDMGWRTAEVCSPGGSGGSGGVKVNQSISCGGKGIPSQTLPSVLAAVRAVDDFTVPVGDPWSIDSVFAATVINIQDVKEPPTVAVTFYSGPAAPTTEVCSYSGLELSPTQIGPEFTDNLMINLPVPCALGPGTYWVEVLGQVVSGGDFFFWMPGSTTSGSEYLWKDPEDIFFTGCTDWTPHTQCPVFGGPEHDLCFGLLSEGRVFRNGFESEDTGEWTSSVP